jgi:hypothetical protein
MAETFWLKLYYEILADKKVARLDDHLWRRMIELFLLAGENEQLGILPSMKDMCWSLRIEPEVLERDLLALAEPKLKIITKEGDTWKVTNFEKRQAPTKNTLRQRRYRENHSNVTNNVTDNALQSALPSSFNSSFNSDSFSTLRDEVIKLTGLQVLQGDIKTLVEWDKEQVTEDDIRDALQWRKDQGLQPVKIISQLAGGVATSRARRVQDQSARKNGGQPKEDLSGLSTPDL